MKELKSIKLTRVLATLFIIVCHIIKYYTFIPGSEQLGQFFNVGVPMFIMISGYLYGKKANQMNRVPIDCRKFFIERLLRVALPCQIWALIVFAATLFAYPLNTLITVLNLQGLSWIFPRAGLLEGSPWLSHTWFVTIILLCYCLVPWLQNHYQIVTTVSLITIYLVSIGLVFIGINLTYCSLFLISYMAGIKRIDGSKVSNWLSMLLIVVSLAGRLLGHRYFDNTALYDYAISGITHHVLAASLIVLIANFTRTRMWVQKLSDNWIVNYIDKHSYASYIVHYTIIELIYSKTTIVVATIAFIIYTIIMSLLLDMITNYLNKLAKSRLMIIRK